MKFTDQSSLEHKFLENMHEAVLILDENYNIIDNNHIANTLYGYTDEEFKKLNLRDIRAPGERDKVALHMNEVSKYEGSVWETIHQRKDGTTFAVEVSSIPIDVGDLKRFYHVVHDIPTAEKKKDVVNLQHVEAIIYLTKHDPLTGLASGAYFEQNLYLSLLKAQQEKQTLALVFIDIENFSRVNESFGHAVGDDLLRVIAQRLSTLPISNTRIARFGAQFAIVVDDVTTHADIKTKLNALNALLEENIYLQKNLFSLVFNYGVAVYPEDGTDVEKLMHHANVALAKAKEIAGSVIQFCTKELIALAQKRINMQVDLQQALSKQEFFLHYQPIVDANLYEIIGFEALIRWQHNGKIISPADFIPLAEKNYLILDISDWVLLTACTQAKKWIDEFQRPLTISVNISPIQFKQGGVLEMLTKVLQSTQLDPTCLKIEITESMLMENAENNIRVLEQIKKTGIKISIDDFGTGYSSLNYLRRLPIDYIKIDRSFVMNMAQDKNDAAIVKTIIDLADNLGYQVIAEGVETQEQLQFLTKLGCKVIQGYYFSPPVTAADASALLKSGKLLR